MNPGTTIGGRFKIERQIGQGGMGAVCLAHDSSLDQRVALKFLSPQIHFDEEALTQLRRETRRSLQLTHHNIVRTHDFHVPEQAPPFISMEYVDGSSANVLKTRRPNSVFPWTCLAPIARQLCDALGYAHAEGIVHRDLKPANILIDSRGEAKLADFGISASINETLARVSSGASSSGTPAYMSPDQMSGAPPTPLDDIYSLGATLYELLTSKPPFHSGNIPFQVWKIPAEPIPARLKALGLENDVPDHITQTIMACLAKDAECRPQTATEVARRLQLHPNQMVDGAEKVAVQSTAIGTPSKIKRSPPRLGSPIFYTFFYTFAVIALIGFAVLLIPPSSPESERTPTVSTPTVSTPTVSTPTVSTPTASIPTDKSIEKERLPADTTTRLVAGEWVNLFSIEHLGKAISMTGLRNKSINFKQPGGNRSRLTHLEFLPWEQNSNWKRTNGVLSLEMAPVARPYHAERTLWFPQSWATNFDAALTFDWPPAGKLQGMLLFTRSITNTTPEIGGLWSLLDGVGTSDPRWRAMWLNGILTGRSPDDTTRFTWGTRNTRSAPLSSTDLKTPAFEDALPMIDRLQNSPFVRSGGHWMMIQARGPKYRIIYNGERVFHGDLADKNLDPPRGSDPGAFARQVANRAGAIALTLHAEDPNEFSRFRHGELWFRPQDGQADPIWTTETTTPP